MQQVQQRELTERMSWARALIFAAGFFLISAILVGQLPSVVYADMTAATLVSFEQLCLSVGVVCLAGFAIVQVIMLLFDPKPVVPPTILTGLGAILSLGGLALAIWSTTTGCLPNKNPALVVCNQYFPQETTNVLPLLGGKFLWFQPESIDLLMISLALLGVGLAMVFYSVLALREQRNPDRRDLGTTPAIRWMIVGSVLLLIVFVLAYSFNDPAAFGKQLFPARPFVGYRAVLLGYTIVLGSAILLALAAFALRLHYLLRPVRKRVMAPLYMVGALGLAQTGAIFIVLWLIAYPLLALIHPWTFIGLGNFLTVCSRETAIPASCSFSQDAGYIVDTIVTMGFFTAVIAAIWAWKSHRNLVIIGASVTTAVIAGSALLVHTLPTAWPTAMMLCVSLLVLAAIMTAVSRREFALVGENNLGCLGMWLVVGTCLFLYLAAFAFFSMPQFGEVETPTNIPFTPGGGRDALIMVILLSLLGAIQFFFLARNRYKA